MIYTLFALLITVLVLAIIIFSNPLRRSEEYIQSEILKLTPIGTSMEDVIKVVESKKKWKVWQGDDYKQWSSVSDFYKNHIIEIKSMEILIGEYWTIFKTSVRVELNFDEDFNLIDVTAKKDTDGF